MRGKERTVRENNVRETRKPKEEKERGGERGQIAEHESRHDESKGVQVCFQKWVDSSVNKKDKYVKSREFVLNIKDLEVLPSQGLESFDACVLCAMVHLD